MYLQKEKGKKKHRISGDHKEGSPRRSSNPDIWRKINK
jgi:hypothetical protein